MTLCATLPPAGLLSTARLVVVQTGDISTKPAAGGFALYGVQRLPSDPAGSFTLTLTNVVVGSRVHVETQSDGTTFYDAIAAASTVVINLSAYAPGSPNNDLAIKVRKASGSPNYQPWSTQATAVVGAQSIYVSQIPDE